MSAEGDPRVKQVGGTHYTDKDLQPWDVIKAWSSHEGYADYLRGNAIKYLARYRDKNGVQDLEKAQHYLEELIGHESSGGV